VIPMGASGGSKPQLRNEPANHGRQASPRRQTARRYELPCGGPCMSPTGLPPFVQLRESRGGVYTAAPEFLDEVIALAERSALRTAASAHPRLHPHEELHRPVSDFHRDPRYEGDLHRADMAWAIYAASRGVPEQQIRDEILHARDLSKKGGPARQLDYVERTASKALTAARAKG
jgi:hypothetical protein